LATGLMKSPQLDTRDHETIVATARSLAPHYVREWNAGDESGVGATLLTIVARLLEGIIHRLNDVPLKNFIAFLESIGVKLLPALPARAPITFFLSSGAKEAVTIPARSQVSAKPPAGGDPIIFETEKLILATPAKLQTIISVVPAKDEIITHDARLTASTTSELFSLNEDSLQAHALYLAHDDLFNVKGAAQFQLQFTPVADLANAAPPAQSSPVWQYCAGEEEIMVAGAKQKRLAWKKFTGQKFENNQVKLDKNQDFEIKQVKVNNINSHWIRCLVAGPLSPSDPLARVRVRNIAIGAGGGATGGVDPDAAFHNDFPLTVPPSDAKPLMPFGAEPKPNPDGSIAGSRPREGDVFYLASKDAFSKRGAVITISLGTLPGDAKGIDIKRVNGIGDTYARLLRENNVNNVFEFLQISLKDTARIIDETNPTAPRSRNIREAAAKEFYDKVVTSGGGAPVAAGVNTPVLSWEYWNGKGWVGINGLVDATNALTNVVPAADPNNPGKNTLVATGLLTFTCPQDIAPTKVLGQESFWIRARIASGDYGQEKITFPTKPNTPAESVVTIDVSNIHPPKITSLKIDYAAPGIAPQYCLTLNNLAYANLSLPLASTDAPFAPFVALEDAFQSLYLGFDRAPLKGPISVFFSLQEQEYVEANRPRIEWQYFRRLKGQTQGEWVRLAVTDGTRNLTQSGTIEFIGPEDFAIEFTDAPNFKFVPRFGAALFWIRAIDDENKFAPRPKAETARGKLISLRPGLVSRDLILQTAAGRGLVDSVTRPQQALHDDVGADATGPTPCDQAIESLTSFITFPAPRAPTPPAPLVQGVYLNTAWSVQAETIQDELLGSSTGSAHQKFTLTKSPVIEESIWVNELATLTETERKTLIEQKNFEIKIKKDAEDNDTEFLIRWLPIEDLAQAKPADRVYEIDRTFGLVTFGDGARFGQVPPIGKDNIKATYRSGGGSRGNVGATLIKSLRSTIPLVEGASNPEAAGGGSDTEPIEKALERGPQGLKNRGRAIAAEDFEWLAKKASQAIARARCLPNFDDKGNQKTGWVTVIIVPDSKDARPLPSPQLRQRVEKYLLERAANVASSPLQVKVIPPAYVAIKVLADIYPLTIDLAPQVESSAITTLQTFLHPLTGGYQNTGWDFGRFPCLSDFYRLLEEIEGVDHVDNLSLTLQATTLLGEFTGAPIVVSEERPVDVTAPPFALVYSGEHKITVKSPIP